VRSCVRLALVPAIFAALSASTQARTWHVRPDGTGDAATLQAGIDSARAGDIVLVAPGRYTWAAQGTGDEYAMIRFVRGKTSFAVTSESGPGLTILDAQRHGRIFYIQGGDNDRVTIEGFTITGGKAPLFGDFCGGAFLAHLSSPIVRNCVFYDNTADRGGAVYYAGVSGPRFEGCTFASNRASTYGGGIFLVNSSLVPVFSGCVIRDNSAGAAGGGIFAYHVPMNLSTCAIYNNTAVEEGGALYSEHGYPATVTGCTIAENNAPAGSALSLFLCEPLTVRSSIVARNHEGSAFSVGQSTLRIGCCDVFGNAFGDDLPAGTVDLGDVIFLDPRFCGPPGSSDYHLRNDSPCLQENQGDGVFCGLIGAFPAMCGQVPVRRDTWSGVKRRF
jgi:hypothetical protein